MDQNQREQLATIQEELERYKSLLTEALNTIKEKIPGIEDVDPDTAGPEDEG